MPLVCFSLSLSLCAISRWLCFGYFLKVFGPPAATGTAHAVETAKNPAKVFGPKTRLASMAPPRAAPGHPPGAGHEAPGDRSAHASPRVGATWGNLGSGAAWVASICEHGLWGKKQEISPIVKSVPCKNQQGNKCLYVYIYI